MSTNKKEKNKILFLNKFLTKETIYSKIYHNFGLNKKFKIIILNHNFYCLVSFNCKNI